MPEVLEYLMAVRGGGLGAGINIGRQSLATMRSFAMRGGTTRYKRSKMRGVGDGARMGDRGPFHMSSPKRRSIPFDRGPGRTDDVAAGGRVSSAPCKSWRVPLSVVRDEASARGTGDRSCSTWTVEEFSRISVCSGSMNWGRHGPRSSPGGTGYRCFRSRLHPADRVPAAARGMRPLVALDVRVDDFLRPWRRSLTPPGDRRMWGFLGEGSSAGLGRLARHRLADF